MPANPPATPTARTLLTRFEAGVVAVGAFGWPIWVSIAAAVRPQAPRGFTDVGLLVTSVFQVFVAAALLAFLRWRRVDLHGLLPRPTWRDTGFGALLYLASWYVSVVVLSAFASDYRAQPIAQMMADSHLTLPAITVASFVNGAYEEVFLLGVLMRGLRGLGASNALGIVLLVRMLYHVYQGPLGVLCVGCTGLLFGLAWLRFPRLWMLVFAHVLWDFVPFVFGTA